MSVVARARESELRAPTTLELEVERLAVPSGHSGRVAAGLSALMVVSLLLGGQRLRTRYWVDEALTVGIASHSIPSIPGVLVRDGSPPLYYLLLAVWTRVFGTSEIATHSLSLLVAVATVPVAFWVGGRLFGRRAAWFTAAFASLCPFLTYFAGETRMYSLVALESILLCAAFAAAFIEQHKNAPWWFAATLTALVYTHYWGLYAAIGAVAAWAFVLASGDRRRLARAGMIGFGVPALAFLPWLPTFLRQIQLTGAPWSHTPTLRALLTELAALVRDERVLIAILIAVCIGLAPVVHDVARNGRSLRDPDAFKMVTLVLIGATPIAIGWVLAHLEPSWATRYLAVSVGPLILLVGFGLSRARWIGVLALGIVAVLIIQPFTRISPGIGIPRDSKSNAGEIAALLHQDLPAGSLVLVSQPEAVPLMEHYLGGGYRDADPRGFVTDPQVMDWRDAEAALSRATVPGALQQDLTRLPAGSRVLLVSPALPPRDTDTSWIERFHELDQQWRQYLESGTCLRPVLLAPAKPADTPYRATVFECS